MTSWSTKERLETVLRLVTEDCIVVSYHMLISILSMSDEDQEMSWVKHWLLGRGT